MIKMVHWILDSVPVSNFQLSNPGVFPAPNHWPRAIFICRLTLPPFHTLARPCLTERGIQDSIRDTRKTWGYIKRCVRIQKTYIHDMLLHLGMAQIYMDALKKRNHHTDASSRPTFHLAFHRANLALFFSLFFLLFVGAGEPGCAGPWDFLRMTWTRNGEKKREIMSIWTKVPFPLHTPPHETSFFFWTWQQEYDLWPFRVTNLDGDLRTG